MSDSAFEQLCTAAAQWGAPLDDTAVARLQSYLEDVRAYNAVTNLTADGAWDDLVLKHAADGVYAAAVLRRKFAALDVAKPRLLDLGAGGGFIGISLKIAWPDAEVSLMEAVERKFRFLNSIAAKIGLPGLRPLLRRAGDGSRPPAHAVNFDAVIERALAPLPQALLWAMPLVNKRGIFAAFQSDEPDLGEATLTRALAATGARLLESHPYRRPREDRDRRLVIFARGED